MARATQPLHWNIEFGIRTKNPNDPDYDFTSPYVQRVPTDTARFTCEEHYETGWQSREDTIRLAREHLAEHGIELPGEPPKESADA